MVQLRRTVPPCAVSLPVAVPRRIVPLAAGLALALPAAAPAATLGLDQRCYVTGEQAAISGSGFLATTSLVLTRGGDTLSPVPSDNSGAFRSTISVPAIPADVIETQIEVTATDGTSTARSFLNITRGVASFTPTVGDLRTLRVRHTVSGFGLSEVRPSIYLHYVSPAAQSAAKKSADATARSRAGATLSSVQKTGGSAIAASDPPGVKSIRLGLLRGPCGVLRTSPRKLFPFKVTDGTWLIQYDTNPRYVAGTSSSSFFWVARKVTITS